MKKAVQLSGILFFSLSMTANSFGQVAGQASENEGSRKQPDVTLPVTRTPVYSKMKTDVVAILEIIYPKVAGNFAILFPAVKNEIWIMDGGMLFVSFFTNTNKASAVFTTGGTMKYAITYLKNSDIPADIAEKIKTAYGSYSIFNTREITVNGATVYQVILENRYEYITLRIDQDSIEESVRLRKYV